MYLTILSIMGPPKGCRLAILTRENSIIATTAHATNIMRQVSIQFFGFRSRKSTINRVAVTSSINSSTRRKAFSVTAKLIRKVNGSMTEMDVIGSP